jgi:hypothetical protein
LVPEGQSGGHKRGNYFYIYIYRKDFYKMKQIKLGKNISSMMGIQVYSNEGPNPLQRGIITKVHK